MNFISNAFSLNMTRDVTCITEQVTLGEVISALRSTYIHNPDFITSAIGHADVLKLINDQLGFNLKLNRITIDLHTDDVLYVGQYVGPRLPEGCKKLPPNSRIVWFRVVAKTVGYLGAVQNTVNKLAEFRRASAAYGEFGDLEDRFHDVARKIFPEHYEEHAWD